MTVFKKVAMLTTVAISALMLHPSTASAAFLPAFSGYTQMSDFGISDGLINFSVYQNNGTTGNWITDLALTGSPPVPVTLAGATTGLEKFVYFYEVVNNNPIAPEANLTQYYVYSGPSPYLSAGYLVANVFRDDGGAVGPAGNEFLVTGADPPPPPDASTGAPSHSGADSVPGSPPDTPPFFVANGGTTAPTAASTGGAPDNFAKFFFLASTPLGIPPNGIGTAGFSPVLFLTSDVGPTYDEGNLRDGGAISNGGVPVQAPEPNTLWLPVAAIFGFVGTYGWRRWRRCQPDLSLA